MGMIKAIMKRSMRQLLPERGIRIAKKMDGEVEGTHVIGYMERLIV